MTDRKQNEPPLGLYDAKQREATAKQREEKAREFGITVEELDRLDDRKVIVTDIQMPFGSMVVFMVKWVIASIPAFIILAVLAFLALTFFTFLSALSQ